MSLSSSSRAYREVHCLFRLNLHTAFTLQAQLTALTGFFQDILDKAILSLFVLCLKSRCWER